MIQIKDIDKKWKFELRPTKGGNIPSTFVHLSNLINKGLSFGDPIIDQLIAAQGKAYAEDGYKEDDTLYRVYNNVTKVEELTESTDEMTEIHPDPIPEKRTIDIPSFMNVKKFI